MADSNTLSVVLKIPFILENGKKHTITLENVSTTLTEARVNTVANKLINDDYFMVNGYRADDFEKPYLYKVEKTIIQ